MKQHEPPRQQTFQDPARTRRELEPRSLALTSSAGLILALALGCTVAPPPARQPAAAPTQQPPVAAEPQARSAPSSQAADLPGRVAPPPGDADSLPKQVEPTHGGTIWSVFLAQGPAGAPELEQARVRARELGYETGPSSIGCNAPVGKGFAKVPEEHQAIVLYFASEADAQQVAQAAGQTFWVGQIKTFCLD